MDPDRFLETCRRKSPPEVREHVEDAFAGWREGRTPPYYPNQVGAVLEEARKLQTLQTFFDLEAAVSLSEGDRIASRRAERAISGWVKDTRAAIEARAQQDLQLPFDSYGEAVRWIEEGAESGGGLSQAERDRFEELEERVRESLEEMAAILDVEPRRASWSIPRLRLPYVRPGGSQVRRVNVPKEGPLHPLAKDLGRVSKATGFRPPVIVAHVLADLPPLLFPVSIGLPAPEYTKLPGGGEAIRREATVTIRSPELSGQEVLRVWSEVRRLWGMDGMNRLKREHRLLWETVQQHGGVPEDNPQGQRFWKRVQETMQDRTGRSLGWRTWQKRWEAMESKIAAYGNFMAPTD